MDSLEAIRQKIYEIRGQRVMLDFDLAEAYGVETNQLKRQVRRNLERFEGEDFMLTRPEHKISPICFYRIGGSYVEQCAPFICGNQSKSGYYACLC